MDEASQREVIVSGVVLLGLMYWLRRVYVLLWPSGVRVGEGTLRWLWRVCCVIPLRRFGVIATGAVWLAALAILATVVALVGVTGLVRIVLALWLSVLASWWVVRWWAQRRYRPREMPKRRGGWL